MAEEPLGTGRGGCPFSTSATPSVASAAPSPVSTRGGLGPGLALALPEASQTVERCGAVVLHTGEPRQLNQHRSEFQVRSLEQFRAWRLDEHFAHRLTRQPFTPPCPIGQDLTIAAVLGEGRGHGLPRVALDLEAVRAPAHVAMRDGHLTLIGPAGLAPSRRLLQQQGKGCPSRGRCVDIDLWSTGVPGATSDTLMSGS